MTRVTKASGHSLDNVEAYPPMATPTPKAGSLDPWKLCDELPGLVCVAGSRGEIVYANAAWRAALGNGDGVLSASGVAAAIHPDDLTAARHAWLEASDSGQPYELQQRIRDRTGTYRWYHLRARPLPADDGTLLYVGVLSDVDEEKRYGHYIDVLGEAGDLFSREADAHVALAHIAKRVVPLAADCFVVYRSTDDGDFVATVVYHRDAGRAEMLGPALARGDSLSAKLVRLALQTGEPALLKEITPELQRELGTGSEARESLYGIDVRSIVVLPIVGRDETWGALQLINDRTTPRLLGEADVQLGRELAKRAASALDNAILVRAAERAADELRFLAHVGESMVESLDLGSRLDRFVNAVVPRLADWATVNLLLEDGSIETAAIAHHDPAKRAAVDRLRGPYYGNVETNEGTPVALRTGRPRLLTGVTERFLRAHIRPETYDDVLELGADSSFVVPLIAHGETYGTLAAMRSERERPFVESDMWLIEELARRAAVAIANARLFERNANVANAFQAASLPRALPSLAGVAFAAYYAPGRSEAMVGGDWYDAFPLGDGRIVVSIGDVSGSGLSAAVVMGSVRQLIRGAVQLQPDARIILDATDRAMRIEFPQSFVTAFVAIVDLERGTITYASAGHPPPFLYTAAGIVALDRVGLPLGLRSDDETPEWTVPFSAGDMLVLYTDGLTESTRDVVEGERAVRAALSRAGVREAPDPARALHDAVIPGDAADDVAILVVTLGGRVGPR